MTLSNRFCQLLVWTALWLLAACSAPPEPLPVLRLGYAGDLAPTPRLGLDAVLAEA